MEIQQDFNNEVKKNNFTDKVKNIFSFKKKIEEIIIPQEEIIVWYDFDKRNNLVYRFDDGFEKILENIANDWLELINAFLAKNKIDVYYEGIWLNADVESFVHFNWPICYDKENIYIAWIAVDWVSWIENEDWILKFYRYWTQIIAWEDFIEDFRKEKRVNFRKH